MVRPGSGHGDESFHPRVHGRRSGGKGGRPSPGAEAAIPIPAIRRGWRLYPDDTDDPKVFRVDFSELGKGTLRVVFSGGSGSEATAQRMFLHVMSFRKRPDIQNPKSWAAVALAGGAALAMRRHPPTHADLLCDSFLARSRKESEQKDQLAAEC